MLTYFLKYLLFIRGTNEAETTCSSLPASAPGEGVRVVDGGLGEGGERGERGEVNVLQQEQVHPLTCEQSTMAALYRLLFIQSHFLP